MNILATVTAPAETQIHINLPPLPPRTLVSGTKTAELCAYLLPGLAQYRHVILPFEKKAAESVAGALQSLLALTADYSAEQHETCVQEIQDSFTRLFLVCDQGSDTVDFICRINRSARCITSLLSETGFTLGFPEVAVDSLDRVYVALPFVRPDGSIRARLTCPIFGYQPKT